MSLICRNNATGLTHIADMKSTFENSNTNVLNRMIIIDLEHEDTYINLENVNITHFSGTEKITKLKVGELQTGHKDIIRMYYDYLATTFPSMMVSPFPVKMKFVLKKKWYRAFDKENNEITSYDDIISMIKKAQQEKGHIYANIQLHVKSVRTHNGVILFQPLIRKISLL